MVLPDLDHVLPERGEHRSYFWFWVLDPIYRRPSLGGRYSVFPASHLYARPTEYEFPILLCRHQQYALGTMRHHLLSPAYH
jgi:hypothetical protein